MCYEAFGPRLREEPNALFIQCHDQELQASRLRFSPRLPPSRLDQASQLSGLLGDDRGRLGRASLNEHTVDHTTLSAIWGTYQHHRS